MKVQSELGVEGAPSDPSPRDPLTAPLSELDLPTRMHNWLYARNILWIGELIAIDPQALAQNERNLGSKSLRDTRRALEQRIGATWETARARLLSQGEFRPLIPPPRDLFAQCLAEASDSSLDGVDLGDEVRTFARREGITTVNDLWNCSPQRMASAPDLDGASVKYARAALSRFICEFPLARAPAPVPPRRPAPGVGTFVRLASRDGDSPTWSCVNVASGELVSHEQVAALSVGKLLRWGEPWCIIEYFISPPRPEVLTFRVPHGLVEVVDLWAETPVYVHNPAEDTWKRGRIHHGPIAGAAIQRADAHYVVRLPNGREETLPTTRLFVRCSAPLHDPTELLAAQITETPFFWTGRRALLHHLTAQREALGGLTALGTAAIELYPHQLAVVRRVLADPIQRYILADEVGLGKTIEAAILVSQHLLDTNDQARVLVLCPDHLCGQWRDELAMKFALDGDPRVSVGSIDDDTWLTKRPSMLVVDEAHQPAGWAFGDPPLAARFTRLAAIAEAAKCVLLLSATPVLHNESGFFAMLHLLDRRAHPLDRLDAFRARVEARNVVAEALGKLVEGTPRALALGALDRLAVTLVGDGNGLVRLASVRSRLEATPAVGDDTEVRELRAYIAETYKLTRRILRTRRDDRALRDDLPVRAGLTWLDLDSDAAHALGEGLVEAWRDALPYGLAGESAKEAARVLSAFLAAHLSHPRCLREAWGARLAALGNGGSALFAAEPTLLADGIAQMEEMPPSDARLDRLVRWLTREKVPRERAVVFVDDPAVARVVEAGLRAGGVADVARCTRGEAHAQAEFLAGRVRVLVCDRTVEEGLNLQTVAASLVFFDLLFEPMRIEQRIGRLDRLEGKKRVHMVGFAPAGAYERAWAALLESALRVFERSVAPLQYFLAAELRRLSEALPAAGPSGIKAATDRLRDSKTGVDAELRRIRNQELIDQLDWDVDEANRFAASVREAEAAAEAAGFEPFDAWLTRCLQFKRSAVRQGADAVHLIHRQFPPTLAPLEAIHQQFGAFVDRDRSKQANALCIGPLAIDRDAAAGERALLLRVGHPFVDQLQRFVALDERGTAWAMWRHLPELGLAGPELYFAFDVVVEADAAPGAGLLGTAGSASAALRRRLDAALPAERRTVWVTSANCVLTDPARHAALTRAYAARDKGGSDTNLRREQWAEVEGRLMLASWAGACRAAREAAVDAVRLDPALARRVAEAARAHARHAAQASAVLESRLARLDERTREAERAVLGFETALARAITAGVNRPSVRVESAGAVVLAPDPITRLEAAP